MAQSPENLIWIDLEMTGLDTQQDVIIEIATVVTDGQLNIIEDGPVIAIAQSSEVLGSMDDWNKQQHGSSGLLQRVESATVDETEAERRTLEFLQKHVAKGVSPMCGNSVCQDRRFLARCMPTLEDYFHYRNLDVSSVKEILHRWAPAIVEGVNKKGSHLALHDIYDSITELRYYRKHAFTC